MSMTGKIPGRGLGDNSLAIEQTLMAAQNNGGYFEDFVLQQTGWRAQTLVGLAATAGGTPYLQFVHTNLPVITWRFDATAANFISASFTVPGQYDPLTDQLYFIAALRKSFTTADNATLAMQMQVRQHLPGSASPSIGAAVAPSVALTTLTAGETALTSFTAPVKRLLPASSVAAVISDFAYYQFDLGNDKRGTLTDALRLRPLESVALEFGPDNTVGGTDLQVQMAGGGIIRWVRSASLSNYNRRFSPDQGAITYNGASRFIH